MAKVRAVARQDVGPALRITIKIGGYAPGRLFWVSWMLYDGRKTGRNLYERLTGDDVQLLTSDEGLTLANPEPCTNWGWSDNTTVRLIREPRAERLRLIMAMAEPGTSIDKLWNLSGGNIS